MISINDFRAFVAQLRTIATNHLNQAGTPVNVAHTVVAIQENHLVNILKDKRGIILAVSAPAFTIRPTAGYQQSESAFLIFVLFKYQPQLLAKEEEYAQYAEAQRLMSAILQVITGKDSFSADSGHAAALQPPDLDTLLCTTGVRSSSPITVDWEYNIFGGYSGISARITITDPSGTAL